MKKILVALLVLSLLPAIPCLAEGAAHTIEEYGISLTIPEGYRLLTPDMAEDDPLLDIYGVTVEYVQEMFEFMPLYLDAVRTDGGGEITVTVQDSTLPDFAEMGMTALESIMREMTSEFDSAGVNVISTDSYAHAQMPFTRTYFENEYAADSGIQYYTVWGGKSYSFALHTYDGAPTEQDEATMLELMEGMRFENYIPDSLPETEPIAYSDAVNGISFTVPAGWQEATAEAEPGVEQAVFTSVKDPACNIVYVSSDLWTEFSSFEKIFSSRKSINNSKFTNHDIGKMIGVSGGNIMNTTINGIEYFSANITQTAERNGVNFTLTSRTLLCIRNARAYMFFYTGSPGNGLSADFEALMETVSFS